MEPLLVKFVPGSVFRVPAGPDNFAYGVMLSHFPYVAFFDKRTGFGEGGVPSIPPMFVLVVAKPAYSKGQWGQPVRIIPAESLPPVPRFFWQSPTNKNDCKIVEPIKRRVPASPHDCVGLEAEAVWSASHIESRIIDAYAGRPNIFAESLRVKL
ncbi:hypothetical protein [Micromonospora aurantiaca (nom. illeg.)]|uniref:Uncharacterized protein n=1 Tax=Micromonospora aurantiaca (nom. illeg.) TaxID=47850 RepID=A0ABQ6UEL0_9ACTN|nr:hypothetical protein [Micromonospora aurantiaca]KAB1110456.1 hypothetical protein F6X54_17760 [Micromonospora aurantiaca]